MHDPKKCQGCGGSGDDLLRHTWNGYERCRVCMGTGLGREELLAKLISDKARLQEQVSALDARIEDLRSPQRIHGERPRMCDWCKYACAELQPVAEFHGKRGHLSCAEYERFKEKKLEVPSVG